MENNNLKLIVDILTYAIKNKDHPFSQKDFKNVVYTSEFNNYDINNEISSGFNYLLKIGLLQLENKNVTYYEKYVLPETIIINTNTYTKIFKDLSKKIILMHEGHDTINDLYEDKENYAQIIEAVDLVNSGFLSVPDKEIIKVTLSKILVSLNIKSKANYSLLTIIQLLSLKSSVLVKIKNKASEFSASNVKFNFIEFKDESMVLYFDKCSFEIDDISNILHIDSINQIPLTECINTSIDILKLYPKQKTKILIDYFHNSSI